MQTCEFLRTKGIKTEVVGTVTLDGNVIRHTAESGRGTMMAEICKRWVIADDERVHPHDDPQRWFANLPNEYRGAYLRARMMDPLTEALREEFHLDHTGELSQFMIGGVIEEDSKWVGPQDIYAILREAGEHWITKDGRRIFIGGDGPHAGKHIMVGISPYREHNVHTVNEVPALFNDKKTQEFEKQIPVLAKDYPGVDVAQVRRTAGVWQKNREASFMVTGSTTDSAALDAYAAKLGESAPEKQMATVSFIEDQKGAGYAYQLLGVKNQEAAVTVLLSHGFEGATVPLNQGKIILFDADGALRGNIKKASEQLGLRYTKVRGHVHFITEDNYAKVQNDYKAGKTEAEEVYRSDHSYLPEASQGREVASKILPFVRPGFLPKVTKPESSDSPGISQLIMETESRLRDLVSRLPVLNESV